MQLHMRQMLLAPAHSYEWAMGSERTSAAKAEAIAVISRWAEAIRPRYFGSAKDWAEHASISPTTITRGMDAEANGTTKIENLHLLAQAAAIPSVLDFLNAQARGEITQAKHNHTALPSADILVAILDEIVAEMGGGRMPASDLRPIGRYLELVLQLVSENPANRTSPDVARAVARTIVTPPHPTTLEV